jgi:hypothetical protein
MLEITALAFVSWPKGSTFMSQNPLGRPKLSHIPTDVLTYSFGNFEGRTLS